VEVGALKIAGRIGSDEVLAGIGVEGVGSLLGDEFISEDRVA
jgi:hypothetical protein